MFGNPDTIRRCFTLVLGAIGVAVTVGAAGAEDAYKAELDALRQSLAKYQDYRAAVRDLYLSTVGCVHYAGEKIDGHMEYPAGGMGIHFVNLTIGGPAPDPLRPNVLLYEPVGGELRLVGAEWLVPLTDEVTERPSLFGQPFQGPMEGHHPLIPVEFVHYDLHVWLFKDNPLGIFSPTNSDVTCADYAFAMLAKPTRLMPGP
jgi:hypothetical protein